MNKRNLIRILLGLALFGVTLIGLKFTTNKMIGRSFTDSQILIYEATGTTTGNAFLVKDLRHVVFAVDTEPNTTTTVQFVGTILNTVPDPTATQSATNQWDYIQVVDLEDGSSLDGDTGFVLVAGEDHKMLEANVNLLTWIVPIITTQDSGTTTVQIVGANDAT